MVTGSVTPAPTELTLAPKMHMDSKRDRGRSLPIAIGTVLGPTGKLGTLWPGSDPLGCQGHHLGRVSPGGGWPGSGEQESLRPAPGDQPEQFGFGRKRPHPIEKHLHLTPRGRGLAHVTGEVRAGRGPSPGLPAPSRHRNTLTRLVREAGDAGARTNAPGLLLPLESVFLQ